MFLSAVILDEKKIALSFFRLLVKQRQNHTLLSNPSMTALKFNDFREFVTLSNGQMQIITESNITWRLGNVCFILTSV